MPPAGILGADVKQGELEGKQHAHHQAMDPLPSGEPQPFPPPEREGNHQHQGHQTPQAHGQQGRHLIGDRLDADGGQSPEAGQAHHPDHH